MTDTRLANIRQFAYSGVTNSEDVFFLLDEIDRLKADVAEERELRRIAATQSRVSDEQVEQLLEDVSKFKTENEKLKEALADSQKLVDWFFNIVDTHYIFPQGSEKDKSEMLTAIAWHKDQSELKEKYGDD